MGAVSPVVAFLDFGSDPAVEIYVDKSECQFSEAFKHDFSGYRIFVGESPTRRGVHEELPTGRVEALEHGC